MNNHPITDYSVCSTAELEALLSAELTKDDPTASLAILAELEARTAKAPDVDAAWDSFRRAAPSTRRPGTSPGSCTLGAGWPQRPSPPALPACSSSRPAARTF